MYYSLLALSVLPAMSSDRKGLPVMLLSGLLHLSRTRRYVAGGLDSLHHLQTWHSSQYSELVQT